MPIDDGVAGGQWSRSREGVIGKVLVVTLDGTGMKPVLNPFAIAVQGAAKVDCVAEWFFEALQ